MSPAGERLIAIPPERDRAYPVAHIRRFAMLAHSTPRWRPDLRRFVPVVLATCALGACKKAVVEVPAPGSLVLVQGNNQQVQGGSELPNPVVLRVVGTDAWSWDAPFVHTAKRFAASGDASIIWEGHKSGREIGYCQIEKLANLEQLPATGFTVICFPVKVKAGSAGWTRAVALIG